jgi:hypothetical protein
VNPPEAVRIEPLEELGESEVKQEHTGGRMDLGIIAPSLDADDRAGRDRDDPTAEPGSHPLKSRRESIVGGGEDDLQAGSDPPRDLETAEPGEVDVGEEQVSVAIDRKARTFLVGVPRSVLGEAGPARIVAAVGSALPITMIFRMRARWYGPIPEPAMSTGGRQRRSIR